VRIGIKDSLLFCGGFSVGVIVFKVFSWTAIGSTLLGFGSNKIEDPLALIKKSEKFSISVSKEGNELLVTPDNEAPNAFAKLEFSYSDGKPFLSYVEVANLKERSVFINLANTKSAFVNVGIENRHSGEILKDFNLDGNVDQILDANKRKSAFLIGGKWYPSREIAGKIQVQDDKGWHGIILKDGEFFLNNAKEQK